MKNEQPLRDRRGSERHILSRDGYGAVVEGVRDSAVLQGSGLQYANKLSTTVHLGAR